MSWQGISWAWKLGDVSAAAKLLALALADRVSVEAIEGSGDSVALSEFACIDAADLQDVLQELAAKTGLIFDIAADSKITFRLPFEIVDRPTRGPRSPDTSPHSIYVVAAASLTKIGISRNASIRLENLQVWIPEQLTLVWSAKGPAHLIRRVERAAHNELAAYRRFSEWFLIEPALAIETVKRLLAEGGPK